MAPEPIRKSRTNDPESPSGDRVQWVMSGRDPCRAAKHSDRSCGVALAVNATMRVSGLPGLALQKANFVGQVQAAHARHVHVHADEVDAALLPSGLGLVRTADHDRHRPERLEHRFGPREIHSASSSTTMIRNEPRPACADISVSPVNVIGKRYALTSATSCVEAILRRYGLMGRQGER